MSHNLRDFQTPLIFADEVEDEGADIVRLGSAGRQGHKAELVRIVSRLDDSRYRLNASGLKSILGERQRYFDEHPAADSRLIQIEFPGGESPFPVWNPRDTRRTRLMAMDEPIDADRDPSYSSEVYEQTIERNGHFVRLPQGEVTLSVALNGYHPVRSQAVTLSIGTNTWMADVPTTQLWYALVMGGNPSTPNLSSFLRVGSDSVAAYHPVENVPLGDIQAFIHRLNAIERERWSRSLTEWKRTHRGVAESVFPGRYMEFRLPTLHEWLYSAMAGDNHFRWHVRQTSTDRAWLEGMRTERVATLEANAWGLHDLFGNVWELALGPDSTSSSIPPWFLCGGSFRQRRAAQIPLGFYPQYEMAARSRHDDILARSEASGPVGFRLVGSLRPVFTP